MARNYAALPHEYLEEMEDLTDEQFGRVCRALLRFSASGELTTLPQPESIAFKRAVGQEKRFQENYDKKIAAYQEAGKKGAAARWHLEQRASGDGNAMRSHGENGKTKTDTETKTKTEIKTDTETETKTEIGTETETKTKTDTRAGEDTGAAGGEASPLPPPGRSGPSVGQGDAAAFFLERIDPRAGPETLADLAAFERELGTEVCVRAMTVAQETGRANWRYVRGILRNKQRAGVKSLADWDAAEAARARRKERDDGQDHAGKPPAEYRVGQWL